MFSSEDRSKMLICIYILIYRHIVYNDGQHHFELLINIIFIYICITKSCQRNGKRCNETDATGMNYYSQFERRQCLESAGRTRREKAKWCFFVRNVSQVCRHFHSLYIPRSTNKNTTYYLEYTYEIFLLVCITCIKYNICNSVIYTIRIICKKNIFNFFFSYVIIAYRKGRRFLIEIIIYFKKK